MTKVLFVSHHLNVAGTETFMMNVYRNVDRQKFKIDFLVFSNATSKYSDEILKNGDKIYRLPDRKSGARYYKSLNSFFKSKSKEYNAIHWCGGNVSSVAPLFYAYKYKIPIRIVHSHNSASKGLHNKILHGINRFLLPRLCTHFFACSTLAGKYFFGDRNFEIINNCVDLDCFCYNDERRNMIREKLGIQKNTIVIGHIGRFDSVKNHKRILDIYQQFSKQSPDSLLLLVGNGELFDEVKKESHNLGINHKVLLLGEREDIPDLLLAMDCFLMPSLFEGLPFVLVEAQATGLPCVVSSSMNKDVMFIPAFDFCNLSDSNQTWIEKIHNVIRQSNRMDTEKYFEQRGYSLKKLVSYLESIYER